MGTTADATVFCRDCGEEISEKAEICPECGVRQQAPPTSDKSPGVAAVLSFVIPGLGQVYNGQLAVGIILGALTIGMALTGFGLILAIPLWIWLIYDAHKKAKAGPDERDREKGEGSKSPRKRESVPLPSEAETEGESG